MVIYLSSLLQLLMLMKKRKKKKKNEIMCLLNNNGFSLSSLFLSSLSFLWIGAQFPQEKFLSQAPVRLRISCLRIIIYDQQIYEFTFPIFISSGSCLL